MCARNGGNSRPAKARRGSSGDDYAPRRFSCRGPVPEPSSGGRRNFGCNCLHTRATSPSPGSRTSRKAAATASKNGRRSQGAHGVDMRRIKLIDSSLNAIGLDMLTEPPKTSRGPSSRRITWSCLSETFTRTRVGHCQAVLARMLRGLPDDPTIVRYLPARDVELLRTKMAGICANVGINPALLLGQIAKASNMPMRALLGRFGAALKNEG